MEKKKNGQLVIIGILAVAILFMSIGFAAYSQRLNVTGNVTVKKATWSVHWDQSTFEAATGSVAVSKVSMSNTDVSFTATLTKPGDKAELKLKAVNDGTFDAKLTAVTLSALGANESKYLTYEVKYGTTTYNATTTGLTTALNAGASEDVTIVVTYTTPADSADLPQEDVTVNLSASLDYEQA